MVDDFGEGLGENLRVLKQRVEAAARRSGRSAGDVRIMGASKRVPVDRLRVAAEFGLGLFGENYVQEALPKIAALPDVEWHLIGGLQTNKARLVVGAFRVIQSVDRWDLAAALDRRAQAQGIRQAVLVEVNLGDEAAKSGARPGEALDLVRRMEDLPGLEVEGLMGMPPFSPDQEASRPYFATLKSLWDQHHNDSWRTLSMGMSGDFEVAIEEGSTLVRIGTALFGARDAGHAG